MLSTRVSTLETIRHADKDIVWKLTWFVALVCLALVRVRIWSCRGWSSAGRLEPFSPVAAAWPFPSMRLHSDLPKQRPPRHSARAGRRHSLSHIRFHHAPSALVLHSLQVHYQCTRTREAHSRNCKKWNISYIALEVSGASINLCRASHGFQPVAGRCIGPLTQHHHVPHDHLRRSLTLRLNEKKNAQGKDISHALQTR